MNCKILGVSIFLAASMWTVGCGGSGTTTTVGSPASITATSGTPQSTRINSQFAAPLVATVKDSNGNPVSSVTVAFTPPANGASATFTNGVNTASTDASGVATSATLSANGIVGGPYMVTATVAGVTAPANFSLTNGAGTPASITATSGTPQSTAINTQFAAPLVTQVLDSAGNPVSGVTVTFTPPANGASATFAGGVNTASTDASGVASATVSANGTVGGPYTVIAAVKGVVAPANFSLTNTAATAPATKNLVFYLSGSEKINGGPNFYALAGVVTIDTSTGMVMGGVQDYNDAAGIDSPQPAGDTITAGQLTVSSTTGQGTLSVITNNTRLGGVGTPPGTEIFSVQFVNANHALVVQFDGSATSSGSMDLQTSTTTPSGPFAFSLWGVDSHYDPIVVGGVFNSSGNSLADGVFDLNDSTIGAPVTDQPFTGKISTPDAIFGRGTITETNLGRIPGIVINYYVVGPEAIRIVDVDSPPNQGRYDSAIGSAFGQGSGAFASASLGPSVFGLQSKSPQTYVYAAAGMFSTSPGSSPPSFSGVADYSNFGAYVSGATISGTYLMNIGGVNGYGSLSITNAGLKLVSTQGAELPTLTVLGVYMTDPNLNLIDPNNTTVGLGGALIVDLDEYLNGTGALTPQMDTSLVSLNGPYAFGAQDFTSVSSRGWEFDFLGQGTIGSIVVRGGTNAVFLEGDRVGIADPFYIFDTATASISSATLAITPEPDPENAGRYIASALTITPPIPEENPFQQRVTIYQASASLLQWLALNDATDSHIFVGGGSLQQEATTVTPLAAINAKVETKP